MLGARRLTTNRDDMRGWRLTWCLCLLAALPPWSQAWAQETRRVAIGPQYDVGRVGEFWFGSGYRGLWTASIELPVLDLSAFAGGLTPVRTVGQAQSLGLALRGADGKAYTFRSLHKHPERVLPVSWRDRWPGRFLRDTTSATHPGAALILPPLATAVGVPATNPRLVIMPDAPRLGEFRARFANEIGTIDEFPLPAADGRPGFQGATEIISSTELWSRWLTTPANRVDSRALLRARVLDLWLENYDRHAGQWRWMRIPGQPFFQPLPEDPDFVLVKHDGVVSRNLRPRLPIFLRFGDRYSNTLEGPLRNNLEVDLWLLADLDAASWAEVARDVSARLTNQVIASAIAALPPEWQVLSGQTQSDLEARRDLLVDYVMRVYRYEARRVDVHATAADETVSIDREPDDTVVVSVTEAGREAPYYSRRFTATETEEIRVYLHGGHDRVTRTGRAGGRVRIRVIADGGTAWIDDSSSGGTDVWVDAGRSEVRRGPGTRVRQKPWVNTRQDPETPWVEVRNIGDWSVFGTVGRYSPDFGLLLGYSATRTAWAFRTEPSASVQTIRGGFAPRDRTGRVDYVGTFRRPASRAVVQLEAYGSSLEHYNYFGIGNDTPFEDRRRHRSRASVLSIFPTIRWQPDPRFDVYGGLEVRHSQSAEGDDTILASQAPIGAGRFGLLAGRTGVTYDSRGLSPALALGAGDGFSFRDPDQRLTGLRLEGSAFYVPRAWSVAAGYRGAEGSAAVHAGVARLHGGLRVGGRRVSEGFAWFDAASIGSRNNHGYLSNRFLGGSSLHASIGLASWIGAIPVLVPVRIGLVALADTGRVWVKAEHSGTVHTSAGGGVMFQPLSTPITAHALVARSREGARLYVAVGYPF